jgi:hypothetical protein
VGVASWEDLLVDEVICSKPGVCWVRVSMERSQALDDVIRRSTLSAARGE